MYAMECQQYNDSPRLLRPESQLVDWFSWHTMGRHYGLTTRRAVAVYPLCRVVRENAYTRCAELSPTSA